MTNQHTKRRNSICLLTMTLLIFPGAWAASGTQGVDQSVSDLVAQTILSAVQAEYPDALTSVEVTPLDPRLQLAACDQLSVVPRGTRLYGRVPVAVSCTAPQQWNVFMTANVAVQREVVVTRGPLARGQRLSADQLTLEFQDLSELRDLHYTSTDGLPGMELKRPLAAGSVLYTTMLRRPLAIRRGDKVAIIARRGGVTISVPGESLENGMAGEQIQVRNRQSNKVVHVWITGTGEVSTSAPPLGAIQPATRQIANLN